MIDAKYGSLLRDNFLGRVLKTIFRHIFETNLLDAHLKQYLKAF